MENPINKHLIFEHFANRATPIQGRMIAEWLAQAENREQYYAWLEEWEMLNPQYAVDVETSLQRSLAMVQTESAPVDQPTNVRSLGLFRTPWQWAAVLAGLFMLAGLYAGRSYILYRSIVTGFSDSDGRLYGQPGLDTESRILS